MTVSAYQPTVRARRVASELRALRLDRDVPVADLASAIWWKVEDYLAAEECRAVFTPVTVQAILAEHDGDPDYVDYFTNLAIQSREHDWTQRYTASTPPYMRMFAGLSRFAGHEMVWNPLVVPAVLRTQGYAEALTDFPLRAGELGAAETIDGLVSRQARIHDDEDPLRVSALIGEGAFRLMAADSRVMAEQIDHLAALMDCPNVSIRIVPFTWGEYARFPEPFTILQYPQPADADIGFFENRTRSVFVDRPDEVDDFHLCFQRLQSAAYQPGPTGRALYTFKRLASQ